MLTIGQAATIARIVSNCAIRSTSDEGGPGVAVVSCDLRPYDVWGTLRTIGDALGFTGVFFDAAAGTPKALASGMSRAQAFSVTERRAVESDGPHLFAVMLDDARDAVAVAMLAAEIAAMRPGGAPTIIIVVTSGPYEALQEVHHLVSRVLKRDPDDVEALKF